MGAAPADRRRSRRRGGQRRARGVRGPRGRQRQPHYRSLGRTCPPRPGPGRRTHAKEQLVSTATVTKTTYTIDKAHSEVTFQVRHLLTKVRERFSDFEGTIEVREASAH